MAENDKPVASGSAGARVLVKFGSELAYSGLTWGRAEGLRFSRFLV
jgi:hypothetical protein